MPLPFDATLKDLVRWRPADFSEGFRLHGPGTPSVVNVDLSVVSAATDVVLAFGDPPRELVDLNFQSSADASLVERLLLYNALLYYRYGAPVHSLLVLLRPAADGPYLTGRLHYRGQGKRGATTFRYEVIRLWQISTRRLLRSRLGMLPLAVLGRLPQGMRTERAMVGVIREMQRRAEVEATPEEAKQILTSAFFLLGARLSEAAGLRSFAGVPLVEDSTTYQYVLRQGALKDRRETLLELGEERFGAPSEVIAATITGIVDLDRLKRMTRRLLSVDTWEALLRTR